MLSFARCASQRTCITAIHCQVSRASTAQTSRTPKSRGTPQACAGPAQRRGDTKIIRGAHACADKSATTARARRPARAAPRAHTSSAGTIVVSSFDAVLLDHNVASAPSTQAVMPLNDTWAQRGVRRMVARCWGRWARGDACGRAWLARRQRQQKRARWAASSTPARSRSGIARCPVARAHACECVWTRHPARAPCMLSSTLPRACAGPASMLTSQCSASIDMTDQPKM